MHFEHLVQINDPLQPLLTEVSRAQLWRGLVRRAERPTEFVLGLTEATIEDRRDDDGVLQLARTLDFGSFRVHDRVRLTADTASVTDVDRGAGYPASRLTIRIEEPAPGDLYLRFLYEATESEGDSRIDAMTRALREQAYKSTDIDTVWRIRDLVERGELG
jgi:hypothetical protein